MKKIITLLLAALTLTASAQTTKKVLFIGNSYTYVNDLPNMLKTLALGCGDTLNYSQSTPGGCTFSSLLSNSTTMNYINAGGWDNVILQEQSQNPAFPIGQVESQCFPYAQQLCESIRATSPDAGIVFYMTWRRKNGDASNCAAYPPICTYNGMDSLLYHRYMMMGERNEAIVSPVGRVWHVLRDNHPEIELYSSDESHPSVAGTYAAAVTFYTILFKKSPECISNAMTLDSATAANIRQTVETVVYDSLDFWYQYAEEPSNISNQQITSTLQVYPNPTSDMINIELPQAENGKYVLNIYNSVGERVHQEPINGGGTVRVSIQKFPAGTYFVEAVSGDGRKNGRNSVLRAVIVKR